MVFINNRKPPNKMTVKGLKSTIRAKSCIPGVTTNLTTDALIMTMMVQWLFLLVLFAFTNDTACTKRDMAILEEYGYELQIYNNTNGPLRTGRGASKWGRPADLAKHLLGVGWPSAGLEAVQ
jgi:hypothetical protein